MFATATPAGLEPTDPVPHRHQYRRHHHRRRRYLWRWRQYRGGIESVAAPGGISISEDAWRQVQGKVAADFVDAGEQSLKNIARPVRVYRLELGPKTTSASEAPRPTSAPPDKPSIAVLAFNNMSGDPEQEYFSDGVSEDIITDLSKLSEFASSRATQPSPTRARRST